MSCTPLQQVFATGVPVFVKVISMHGCLLVPRPEAPLAVMASVIAAFWTVMYEHFHIILGENTYACGIYGIVACTAYLDVHVSQNAIILLTRGKLLAQHSSQECPNTYLTQDPAVCQCADCCAVYNSREEQRLQRIRDEGWDRFAPESETNRR